ncbi:NAD(P)-dependent alcohol dehydrogenase [Paenibacillus sp. TRM 82003]|nr:NAD(P)-dependent alcohol dehydrogenase [Paenibacillus sp. TRM 82003]
MKAIVCNRYGPPDVLRISEVAKPVPKDNEILVKVHATTVTVADVRMRGFSVPASVWIPARLALGVRRPRKEILGVELSGEVEAVGTSVTRFRKGDAVYAATLTGFGAYAEYRCLREDGAVAIKPDNLTYEEAAAVPIGARTALHYLKKANVGSGQRVLVYGASGSVGTYAVQLAKAFGARVTGVCSAANAELVRSLGADDVIDYAKEDFSSQGAKYDVVFEAVNKSSFEACMAALRDGGVYINITEPMPSLRMLQAKLTGSKKLILGQNAPDTAEALIYLKDLIEAGSVKANIDRVYSMEQIVEAHTYVEQGRKKGNVVITVS